MWEQGGTGLTGLCLAGMLGAMSTPPTDPDQLGAPALRRALTVERERRQALATERARLAASVARQNAELGRLDVLARRLGQQVRAVAEQLAAVSEQNQRLREEVVALREENARLRAASGEEEAGAARRPPPSWAKPKTTDRPRRPREKRATEHNTGRHRAPQEAVTTRVRHEPSACPHCRTALPDRGGWIKRRVQQIELPPPQPAVVTEHELVARRCPGCRRAVVASAPGEAAGRIGRCRFGPRLVAAVAHMRTIERLPQRQIVARLAREYGLRLSHGGLVGLLHLAARRARARYDDLGRAVRQAPVVNIDETSWREDGQHGYVWAVTTPTLRYFHRDPSRSGAVADALLGPDYAGTIGCDGYAAYDHFPGPKQRCWAHLWRDVDTLLRLWPQHAELAAWAAGLRTLYRAATGARPAGERGDSRTALLARRRRAGRCERLLLGLCPPSLPGDQPHATMAATLRRRAHELFTFVRDPAVSPTNNLAERSLRPLVIARKISGGTRSAAGSDQRMVLASVLGTAQLQGEDPDALLRRLLLTPP